MCDEENRWYEYFEYWPWIFHIVVKLLPVLTDGCTMYHKKSVCVYICKLENYSVHIICKKSVLPIQ